LGELRNRGFAAQSDGGGFVVGICPVFCGAEDRKIAACGRSYR
jgi:hypothetical protein